MKPILVIFCSVVVFSCGNGPDRLVRNFHNGAALGTTYNITYLTAGEVDVQQGIDSVFAAVNQSMSTYLPQSDISRINSGDTTVVVDQMFREVFELSREVNRATDGAFDPTVGVLVNAWGFGPGKSMELDSAKVDSLLNYVGFHKVMLTTDNKIVKQDPKIALDFNAIAKGYAIDRLAMMLSKHGIQDYLVEVGGEIVAKGENKVKDKPWVVGVEEPLAKDERQLKTSLRLKDRALASSGNYRKFRIDPDTGKKYVHTIDPRTGYTKDATVLGASVIAADCATADAYATAFMVMDLDDSRELLTTRKDLEAYIVYLNEEGVESVFMTPGFKSLIIK